MKRLLSIFLLLCTFTCKAQSFEGSVTYSADIEVSPSMAKMGMTRESVMKEMSEKNDWSDSMIFYYKQGNVYELMLNRTPKCYKIYLADSNKIYSMKDDGQDLCAAFDVSTSIGGKLTAKTSIAEKLDTVAVVNGVSCNVIRIKDAMTTYDYYYDPTKLVIDPALFAQYSYQGWNEYLKIARALPLRIVASIKGMMTETKTLISYKAEPVDDKLFSLPVLVRDDNSDLNALEKMMHLTIFHIKR
jgi:hypothetical protein